MRLASTHPSIFSPGQAPTSFATASTLINIEAQERFVATSTGEPLPLGSAIELGYFDAATIHSLFEGEWTPLIGLDAPKDNRSISPIFCGHGGEGPGRFTWCRTFFEGVDALPPSGRPLALRIYDHPTTAEATCYNTVSHPSWWFREPRSPSPAFVFMSLDEPRLAWESGPDGAFRTCLDTAGARGGGPAVLRRALRVLRRQRVA